VLAFVAFLAVGLLLLGGQLATYTYLTPFLNQVTGVHGATTSVFLLVYGLAAAVGTFVGGRGADRGPAASRPIDTMTDQQRKGRPTCTSSRERPETSAASWYERCTPAAKRSARSCTQTPPTMYFPRAWTCAAAT